MTAQERYQELEAKHAQARGELDKEVALYAAMPPELLELNSFAHMGGLWDRVGSLTFRYYDSPYLMKGAPAPTLQHVAACMLAFPPVPLSIYRDGCVSVRTADDAQRAHEKAQSRMAPGHETRATITPIASMFISFEAASYSRSMEVEYIGTTPIGRVSFKFQFPINGAVAVAVGQVNISYESAFSNARGRMGDEYETKRIHSKHFRPTTPCKVIGSARLSTLNYADSQDKKEPGEVLAYWESCDGEHANVSIWDLIERTATACAS